MPGSLHRSAVLPIDALLAKAQSLVDTGDLMAANRLLSAALEASSGNDNPAVQAKILTRLGLLYKEQRNLDQALAAFLVAHLLQPSDTLRAYIAEQQRDA